ncbi:MAG: exonuclease SbcCD subunit D C-terminal domain-containing protein [Desulfobacula sp.]|nr:exonuclease SbcCD subunit D C-terminal domain-containing protein [Desulfobacula sp.]
MKFLHTSDWHIGRTLYGRKRYEEFAQFLDWLVDVINTQNVDVLLVAGDVFDTTTPSNRAQSLYYRFLCKVAASVCHHVVVIGGNHDSPSFLNAPKELLKAINVDVVGSASQNLEDEVVLLSKKSKLPEAIVCAVPYLRDRDVRQVKAKESLDDKSAQLTQGVKDHYSAVCKLAQKNQNQSEKIPIIGMGHLFAAGGRTVEGDGVRELYVGSLSHVGLDAFPKGFDYVALGHLHVPQRVGKKEMIRYSGSPIPMGYGEAEQTKQVVLVQFDGQVPIIETINVPCFQELKRISGNMTDILADIEILRKDDSHAWLEIDYTGDRVAQDLKEQIETAVGDTNMEIRRIRNRRLITHVLQKGEQMETLEDLDVQDVFVRLLDAHNIVEQERVQLTATYMQVVNTLLEKDIHAE